MSRRSVSAFICVHLWLTFLSGQAFQQRGFLEFRPTFYPQTAPGDRGQVIGEALFRYDASYKFAPWIKLSGVFDARTDSHRQVEREWRLDAEDRGLQRPAFSVRRLSATLNRGKWTLELGRQFIRWGKADLLNPTDRFAPRDYLSVVDNDFLGVTAARLTYETKNDTVDLVYQPRFMPSRGPLLNQRWVVLPAGVPVIDGGSVYPGGPQFGARWNRLASGYEYSLSFFEGYNHLPLITGSFTVSPLRVILQRYYPQMRMYGGDLAIPLRWFTVKTEAAYFTSRTSTADEYVQYVVQLERMSGEWSFVGGYAGEYVTEKRAPLDFAPDRGLARAFLGRAGYTIDANRSVAFEAAVRQNGEGVWTRAEYSQLLGQHLRATASFTLIRGNQTDFLGQYRRNSHLGLAFRYSF